ncbi:MAG: TadE family protein [Pseudomonadota bacterium]
MSDRNTPPSQIGGCGCGASKARAFLKEESGAATVDFVAVVGPLVIIFLLVLDLSISYVLGQSLTKAAHMGARIAAVSDPAVADLPAVNEVAPGGEIGLPCSDKSAPCKVPSPSAWSCVGGAAGCDDAAFTRIVAEVQGWSGVVNRENVTVRYEYVELGRAGGPLSPAITVQIANVPSPIGFLSNVRAAFRLDGADLSVLPSARAVVIAEDLNAGPS